jgi:phosphonopyruvate decarboxylase
MMPRDQCFRMLAELRGDAIVVATYTSAFEWRRTQPHKLNFVTIGAMGQASSQALGLAIGLPDHKVIVLDGDGSLLMNLGTLVTIANARPRNLVHFVVENGCYEANGSHPIPGQGRVSFAGFARAAGYAQVFEFDGLNRFAAELPAVLAADGPVFATLKVVAADPPPQDYEWTTSPAVRREFKAAIRPLLPKRG